MKQLPIGARPLIMGIVNVTPDSFSDGGKYFSTESAVQHGLDLITDGADIIDIGGESTRPGAEDVFVDEEYSRVIPVIKKIIEKKPDVWISVDTRKSEIARAAIECGACMINDVSGLSNDPNIAAICAQYNAYLVIMHTRGTPAEMQKNTEYTDLVTEVSSFLRSSAEKALAAGVKKEKIILDPGIGFGKSLEQNYELLNNTTRIAEEGYPVLIGLSRKSLIWKLLPKGSETLSATIALNTVAVEKGAAIIRVHDVKEHRDALICLNRLREVAG